jgi:Leucine-rich repeat (LRR) protein
MRNALQGPPLPKTLQLLAPLKNLKHLQMSNNKLGGFIPADVAVFVKLENLDLVGMGLAGELPKELGDLVNLKKFDASNNQLQGDIPASLLRIPSVQLDGNVGLALPYSLGESRTSSPTQ